MDAIDQLALLHKALKGSEQAGHKYKSRKRLGSKWSYDYGDKKGKPKGASPVGPVPERARVTAAWHPTTPGYVVRLYALSVDGKKGYLLRTFNKRTQEPVDSGTVYKTYAAGSRAGAQAAMKPKPAQQPLTAKAVARAKADVASITGKAKEASGNSVERNRNIYGQFPKGAKWKKPSKGVLATARASIREAIDAAVKHGHSPFDGAGRYARSTFSSGSLATR